MARSEFMWKVRTTIRARQYSYQTEKTYVYWIKHFIHFFELKHPSEMGDKEVNIFLSYLAVERKVAPATQNQALCALVFLYKRVLECPLGEDSINAVRSKHQKNLPTVLSPPEIKRLLEKLNGLPKLIAQIIYGTGLRKTEVHQLRVKDIDFDRNIIMVRRGKGGKDRPLPLPQICKKELEEQINFVKELHRKDRRESVNGVALPFAIERKDPNAGKSLAWQWVFPSLRISSCPRTLIQRRHHVHPSVFAKHIQAAVKNGKHK